MWDVLHGVVDCFWGPAAHVMCTPPVPALYCIHRTYSLDIDWVLATLCWASISVRRHCSSLRVCCGLDMLTCGGLVCMHPFPHISPCLPMPTTCHSALLGELLLDMQCTATMG
jgi:hypothetical protein